MHKPPTLLRSSGTRRALDLARVLVVHGELAPRLALRTILQAGGYSVDVAGSPAEAISKLDASRYDLVLCDTGFGTSNEGGRGVLAYARIKDYRPATALVTFGPSAGWQLRRIDRLARLPALPTLADRGLEIAISIQPSAFSLKSPHYS